MRVIVERVVLDVLKPRELASADLAENLCLLDGVEKVNVIVKEVDARTETIRLIVEGADIQISDVLERLDEIGCAVRSVDSVTARKTEE